MEREQDRNYNCFRWRNIRINIIFICHVVTLTLEREILYEENIIGKINYFKSYLKVSERLLEGNLKQTKIIKVCTNKIYCDTLISTN